MNRTKNIHVSDTAFVTCGFRRLNEALSGDSYAKLWYNSKAEIILKDYLAAVSTEEINTHCIRNRFFLETIKTVVKENKIEVLINFGAGFSMYPFLLSEKLLHIEIDKPELVKHKSKKIQQWVKDYKLPARKINFIGIDFSEKYENQLRQELKEFVGEKKCFILIEGVLFFLNTNEINRLFSLFNTIQSIGDYIGSVSYTHNIKTTDAYTRLIKYATQGVKDASNDGFQTIEHEFYKTLKNYKLINHQDYFSCSEVYNNQPKCEKTNILNEHFYILKKQK
ncbi:MAG: adenosine deaminase [Winogradskyella sp.]|nr:MAG: adenosine deaminase [Winogradskyella sp.]